MKYLERAQASNRRESEAVLGGLLLSGNGVAHDYPRGLTLLREAAEQGSFWALGSLAQIYANGSFGVEKSPAAGYTLVVSSLPPGNWDVVVYAHSAVSGTFDTARLVRITIP